MTRCCPTSARRSTSRRGSACSPTMPRACRCRARTTCTTRSSSPKSSPAAKPEPETTDSFDGGAALSQLQDPGPGLDLEHHASRTARPRRTIPSSTRPCTATSERSTSRASTARSPGRRCAADALCLRLAQQVEDQGQHADRPAAGVTCDNIDAGTAAGLPTALRSCAFTAGQSESGSPKYTYGFSALGTLGPVDLGVTAKRTGPRYIYDTNAPIFRGDIDPGAAAGSTDHSASQAPAYWLVNLDARFNMKFVGLEGNLLPAQRLQSVRQILCRRVRRRPQPDGQQRGRVRCPELRPDRRSAHRFGDLQPVVLIARSAATAKAASPSGGAVFVA